MATFRTRNGYHWLLNQAEIWLLGFAPSQSTLGRAVFTWCHLVGVHFRAVSVRDVPHQVVTATEGLWTELAKIVTGLRVHNDVALDIFLCEEHLAAVLTLMFLV